MSDKEHTKVYVQSCRRSFEQDGSSGGLDWKQILSGGKRDKVQWHVLQRCLRGPSDFRHQKNCYPGEVNYTEGPLPFTLTGLILGKLITYSLTNC